MTVHRAPDGRTHAAASGRHLNWFGLIVLLLAIFLVPAFIDNARDVEFDGEFPTLEHTVDLLPSTAIELALVVLAITLLRWWRPVAQERLRARPWAWIAILPLVLALGMADWSRVVQEPVIAMAVAAIALCIGFSEELFFRGLVLTFMRQRYREGISVVLTTVLFAALHFTEGIPGILTTLAFGGVLYVLRRVSGGIVVPGIVHSVIDFAIWTAYLGSGPYEPDSLSLSYFLLSTVLVALFLVLRRRAFPQPEARAQAQPDPATPTA